MLANKLTGFEYGHGGNFASSRSLRLLSSAMRWRSKRSLRRDSRLHTDVEAYPRATKAIIHSLFTMLLLSFRPPPWIYLTQSERSTTIAAAKNPDSFLRSGLFIRENSPYAQTDTDRLLIIQAQEVVTKDYIPALLSCSQLPAHGHRGADGASLMSKRRSDIFYTNSVSMLPA